MDIHKPKPVHGWREFLSEVGIIVLGVVLALSAEQAVEALHWGDQVGQTREALVTEIQHDTDGLADRVDEVVCVDRRLDEVRTILSAHAAGRSMKLVAPIGRPRDHALKTASYAAAEYAGVLVHMALKERNADADLYNGFTYAADLQLQEREAWGELALLDEPQILTPSDWSTIARAYAHARNINQRLSTGMPGSLSAAKAMGIKPGPLPPRSSLIASVCTPVLADGA
jgi:hypothetical protein